MYKATIIDENYKYKKDLKKWNNNFSIMSTLNTQISNLNSFMNHVRKQFFKNISPSKKFTKFVKASGVNCNFEIAVMRRMYGDQPSKALLQRCRNLLNVSSSSNLNDIRDAFIKLAKKYHPDSGSQQANMSKFCEVEEAYRMLMSHQENVRKDSIKKSSEFDIQHTAPQHRQYLSYCGMGHGTVAQRERQWHTARAVKAANNVMEHRVKCAVAKENALVEIDAKKHKNNKTQNQFERLVEELIQESMSKGDFDNLTGSGKPLKRQNLNPYVDLTTHKLNQVLINNGFTPEWILLNKEIRKSVDELKKILKKERALLGPHPLSEVDQSKWTRICHDYKGLSIEMNKMISKYHLLVPLLNMQMLLMNYGKVSDTILITGEFYAEPIVETTFHTEKDDIFFVTVRNFKSIVDIIRSMFKKWRKNGDTTRQSIE